MTKICKEKQLAKLGKIAEAIPIFKDWRSYGGIENAVELLAQIQQAVIEVGTVIEQDLNDYSGLVADSEQLCELLYQISLSLDDRHRVCALVDDVEKKLRDMQEELRMASPRKEVVFLPYQISMWDSLESVWLEAKEDTEADCYVVPIPFYNVQPDGSLGELYYQGADYPDNIPVTFYEDYLLEERHPDVIFFHNPYDDCNLVTRVPERYYASQLKKCTEKLVYIPYFASPVGGPSDRQCYMPGVLFADKVIVQPESVYDTYCRVYTAIAKENGWERILAPAEDKFLPLGSPKFDKIFNINCEIGNLPKSWQKVVQKPDGSRKKVILYNVTITGLLSANELALKKVEDIFKLFKKRQDEAVLLWRPHPLLMSTINSMRPHLRDAYLALVKQMKEEGWGIFDETPDANLAMALSDAYYGDWSSLIVVYEVTGKPIRLHSLNGTEENELLSEVLESGVRQNKENVDNTGEGKPKSIGSSVYHAVMSAEGPM